VLSQRIKYVCSTQEEVLVSTEIEFDISLVLKKSYLRKLATSPRKLLYYLTVIRSRIDADKARPVDKQLVTDEENKLLEKCPYQDQAVTNSMRNNGMLQANRLQLHDNALLKPRPRGELLSNALHQSTREECAKLD